MKKEYKFAPISEKQIKAMGVQALADRPNATGQYGQGGFSPTQLKLWFDKLVTLTAGKINELQEAINGEEAAKYIGLALEKYKTLDDLIEGMQNGSFADELLMIYPNVDTFEPTSLQQFIFQAATMFAEHQEQIESLEERKLDETNIWGVIGHLKGDPGDQGVGIEKIEKTFTSGLVDTYTITLTNSNTYYFTVTNGEKGDPGEGFRIAKSYSSVEEMHDSYDTDGLRLFSFVIIETGNVNDEDNSKLFIKLNSGYSYLTDLSGSQGIQGPPGDSPYVGANGNWWVGGTDTGVLATNEEVVNITSIDTLYPTAGDLPATADNGTRYVVLSDKAIYKFDAALGTWVKRFDLKGSVAYFVISGKKAGIYRYTNTYPYLVSAEEAINKEIQNISSIDTIYDDVSKLPTLTAAKNGTKYVAKTNGNAPFVIYSWNGTLLTWERVDEVREETVYYVLNKDYFENALYRFNSVEETFVPLQVETQINLSNVDDIYPGLDSLIAANLNVQNGDNRIVGELNQVTGKAKAPLYVYTYVAAKNTWKKKLQLNNHTVYMCNSYSQKYGAQAYSLYRCRPNYCDFKLLNNPYGNGDLPYSNTNISWYDENTGKHTTTTLGMFYKHDDPKITGYNIPFRTKEGYMKCATPETAGDTTVANVGFVKNLLSGYTPSANSSLHVGAGTPPEGATVWIDTGEESSGYEDWIFEDENGESVTKQVVAITKESVTS